VKADESEMLTLGTNHPPKTHEHLSLFLNSSEPLLKAPNSKFKAFKNGFKTSSKGPLQTRFKSAREMNEKESPRSIETYLN